MTMTASQARSATKLHAISLKQAMKAAKAAGWSEATVKEVANLEWGQASLAKLIRSCRATKRQAEAIQAVRDAAKFEMIGSFAVSQLA